MKRRRRAASDARDRGSAAVEFALLLPVLLLLIFGVIDFGRAINDQITLTQAAREGARLAALGYSTSSVQTRAQNAATGLSPVTVTVSSSCPTGAGAGVDAVVQTSYSFSFITPVGTFAAMFGSASFGSSSLTLSATGDMPCETLSAVWPARRCGCCAATSAALSACSSGC
jgi:Flp pilus assembly protein TadG